MQLCLSHVPMVKLSSKTSFVFWDSNWQSKVILFKGNIRFFFIHFYFHAIAMTIKMKIVEKCSNGIIECTSKIPFCFKCVSFFWISIFKLIIVNNHACFLLLCYPFRRIHKIPAQRSVKFLFSKICTSVLLFYTLT